MVLEMIYMLPMLLGRTWDMKNDMVGMDIFSPQELLKAQEQSLPSLTSIYKLAETSKDVKEVLDVSGALSMKVKAGTLDLKGSGSYLRDSTATGTTIEVLTRMTFQTVVVSLPSTSKPLDNWNKSPRDVLGTHYVRSITYGGEIVASIRFRAHKEEDVSGIKAEVSGKLQGQLDNLVAEGKLDSLEKSLKDKASLEISYFATVPLKGVPNTIEGLKKLVREFKNHVQDVNDGKGVPIRVELVELSTLDGSFPEFVRNEALTAAMDELETQFDELRQAKARLTEWVKTLPTTLKPEQEAQITAMMKRLTDALRPFYSVIGKLDVEQGPEQLQAALDGYNEDAGYSLPGKFRRLVERLIQKMEIPEPKVKTGSSTYVRWGRRKCGTPDTTTVHAGYVASAVKLGTGGGTNVLCLPPKPQLGNKVGQLKDGSYLGGMLYGLMKDAPFEGVEGEELNGQGAVCALCHITNRAVVTTVLGQRECPSGWTREYSGFVATTTDHRSQNVCLDRRPSANKKIREEKDSQSLLLAVVDSGPLGSESDKDRVLPCAVCSV